VGSSSRALALQAQSPEFKPQSHKKKKKKRRKSMIISQTLDLKENGFVVLSNMFHDF
jgi:hypothetical protein